MSEKRGPKVGLSVAERKQEIVKVLKRRPGISRADLCAELGITPPTLKKPIEGLCESGAIMQELRTVGCARVCFYYLPEDAPRNASFKQPRQSRTLRHLTVTRAQPAARQQTFSTDGLSRLLGYGTAGVAAERLRGLLTSSYEHHIGV